MLTDNNQATFKRRNLKLALNAVCLSTLFSFLGYTFFTLPDVTIPFTDTPVPEVIFQILAVFFAIFAVTFSLSLVIPPIMDFFDQLFDLASTSMFGLILTTILFCTVWAATLTGFIQGVMLNKNAAPSLPVLKIALGWLVYVAVIMVIDLIKPDWREAVWSFIGKPSTRVMDYTESAPRISSERIEQESEVRIMSRQDFLSDARASPGINWAFLLTGVFAVVVAGAFGYYYWQTTNTIAQRNLTIATQQAQIAQLNSQIASLQGDLTTANSTITSLQGQLSSTQAQLASAQAQVLSQGNELSTSKSQISTLQSEVSTYQTQVTTLQSEKNYLQNIVNLSLSTVQASGYSINQPFNQETLVSTFTANYAGYIIVSGSSSSANGYIRVTESYSSYSINIKTSISTSGSVLVPVLPGTVYVYFGNTDGAGTVTATMSVTYYY